MYSGARGEYQWLVTAESTGDVRASLIQHHLGLHLGITSFDSGVLCPIPEGMSSGWVLQDRVPVSPELDASVHIPTAGYDEWYIVRSPDFDRIPQLEVFVNYLGFSLVDSRILIEEREPQSNCEPHTLDHWAPIQERFWSQLLTLAPETYVAIGDNTLVVSRRPDFIACMRQAV